MLAQGDKAPDFSAPDQNGNAVTLDDLVAKGPVVVFFYPRAMTKGCTAEACHFRDLSAEFADIGAQLVGVSSDSVDRQAKFAGKNLLEMPLLSDPDREIAAAFGVRRPGPLFNRRATFVIGADKIIVQATSSELNMEHHADAALSALRKVD